MIKSTQTDYPEPAWLAVRAQMCAATSGFAFADEAEGRGRLKNSWKKEKVGGGEQNCSGREPPWGLCMSLGVLGPVLPVRMGRNKAQEGLHWGARYKRGFWKGSLGGSVWFGDAVLLQVPLCYPTAASPHPLAARKGVAGSPEQPGMPVFSLVQSAHPALERAGSTPSGRGTTGTCWGEMKFLAAWLSAARMKTRPTL